MPLPRRPSLRQFGLWICLLVVVTRLPAVLHRRANNDEAYYALVAQEMLHGGLPYQDAVDRKPPLLYSVYWAVFRVAGFPNWIALHAVAVGWTLATMGLLYLLASTLFTPWAGVIAAGLYGAFQPLLRFSNLAFNGELIMNLPACAAILLAIRPGGRRKPLELAAAGGLVAIAFLCKQPSGIVLLPLLVYCLHPDYRRSRGIGAMAAWWHSALVLAGFGVVMGMTALALHADGILGPAWYWTVRDHDLTHGPLDPVFWEIVARSGWQFLAAAGPLLLGAWWSLRNDAGVWRDRRAERDALIAWLLASLIGVAASGRFFGHYFIQLLPPLAVLAAPVFARCWAEPDGQPPLSHRRRRLLLGWSALSILFSFGAAVYDGVLLRQAMPPATAWLRARARPDDRLFVWGQDPHIYLDSGLRPASRYIAYFPLTGYVFGLPESWDPSFDTSNRIAPGSWDHLAEDFERHPPQYILDMDAVRTTPRYRMSDYPYLSRLVERDYVLDFRGPDALVYSRRH